GIARRARVGRRRMKRLMHADGALADFVARPEVAADRRGEEIAIDDHGEIADREARGGAKDAEWKDDVGMALAGERGTVREMKGRVVLAVERIELFAAAAARSGG